MRYVYLYANGNDVKMRSSNRLFLFIVILFSCSICLNGKNVIQRLRTNSERRQSRQSDNYDNDEYVMEDMSLVQHDQPRFLNEPPPQSEPKKRMGSLPGNLQFTKEVLIKQGRLKGYVRLMHPQTGLKNVRQYLGIPYAAAPIGNGRFMPPGLYMFVYLKHSRIVSSYL